MITIASIAIVTLVGVLFALMAVTPALVEADRPSADRRLKLVVVNDPAADRDSDPRRVA